MTLLSPPPLATKPPCEIRYDKATGTCDVITNNDVIEAWDRETVRSVRQSETLGKSFRNRWAFVDVGYLIGQMLLLTQEHKLQNPKNILIPLIKKHIRNRNGEAEILLEGFNVDGIEEVREGGEITGFSLPVVSNGTPAHRLIYNMQNGDTIIQMRDGKSVYVKVETSMSATPSKDEIATRLSQLQKIRDKQPDEITDGDKQYLVEVAKYFNLYPEYLIKETDKKDIRRYAIALSILSSAELASLNLPQTPFFALSAVDEIGTAFFSHELGHVVDDIAPLDYLSHTPLKDSETQKDVTKFIDRFTEYAQVTGAWQKMLDEWKGLKALNPNLILSLIDSLAQHLEDIMKLRAELKKYLKEHSDKIGQEIVDEYSRGVKRAEGECAGNLIQIRGLKQDILQSRASTLIDVNESIESALKPYRTDERLTIQSELNRQLPKCYGNTTKVAYIWTNLIRNSAGAIREATKADKTRKGTIAIRTQLAQRDNREYIEVVFSDNGNGIPEEMLRDGRLFQRGVTTKQRGTGLGLYLIHQTIQDMGGTIDVQSEVGKGTTFTIRLPITSAGEVQACDKLTEYIKSTTGKEIVDMDASSPEQIAESLKNGDVIAVSFENLKAQPDKYKSVKIALYGIGVYMQRTLPRSVTVGELQIIATEILKNAFVHGNQLNFGHPIYLHVKQDGELTVLEVFDIASAEKASDKEMKEAETGELHGFGMGEQWLSRAPYKRQSIKDEIGTTIGTVASLALNPKGWDNPLANSPDTLTMPAKITSTKDTTPPTPTATTSEGKQRLTAEEKVTTPPVAISPESERIHTTNFQDTLTYIQAQPQAQPLIVALGTSWIKGYEKGRYLQYDALNPLIGSLRTYCESKGIPFIVEEDDKLLARINEERAKEGKAGAKVVVLAGKDTVASDEFTTLRNDQKNTFVVGVDNQELTTDSYIRLMEMLTLALKLSAGLEVSLDNTHITITMDRERHLYIFLPHAEPMDYEQLKTIYEVQKFA